MIKDDFPERVKIRRSFSRRELSEITLWLIGQTGNVEFWDDCHVEEPGDATLFYFKEQHLALLFKLRWETGR